MIDQALMRQFGLESGTARFERLGLVYSVDCLEL